MTPTETPTPAAVALGAIMDWFDDGEWVYPNREACAQGLLDKIADAGISLAGPDQRVVSRATLEQARQAFALTQAVLDQLAGPDSDRTIRQHIDAAESEVRAALGAGDGPEGEIQHG